MSNRRNRDKSNLKSLLAVVLYTGFGRQSGAEVQFQLLDSPLCGPPLAGLRLHGMTGGQPISLLEISRGNQARFQPELNRSRRISVSNDYVTNAQYEIDFR